jgi:predicted Zn-dependent protease
MRRIWIATLLAALASAAPRELKPGWNLFSTQQDVQLGREASRKIESQVPMVRSRELDAYLNTILRKLERSQYAHTLNRDGSRGELFPFTIHAVQDPKINAFSLPGGPVYVNTGLIAVADNEAQLAGVIGHEMSHIVLRHSTSQASKQNVVALPVLLASAIVGNRSLLGELTQIGIAFTANSALLKFTRGDEEQADYNGAELAADIGYNPLELANFFEKLEAKSGHQGNLVQLLSDHPNPGNRVAAVQEEIRQFPRRSYSEDQTGQFVKIKDVVRHLPAAKQMRASEDEEDRPRTSSGTRAYRGESFSFAYPDNWEVVSESDVVTIAPRDGLVNGAIGYGLQAGHFHTKAGDHTQALIRHLRESNTSLRISREARSIEVAGQPALLTTLSSRSPYPDGQEVDALVTVERPEGLFYMIFIAPKSEFDRSQPAFEEIVKSVRF